MTVPLPRACALLAAVVALWPLVGLAQEEPAPSFERLRAEVPPDGAVVTDRPVFQLAFDGVEPAEARRLRFRIVLDPADDDREPVVFDQRRRRSGWLVSPDGTAVFRPKRPLADGAYTWRVEGWNGVEWLPGDGARKLRIDTIPPAGVEEIRVERDPDAGTVRLVWQPVVLDATGAPEYVTRYHVYRYADSADRPQVQVFEVGVVEVPEFTDQPGEEGATILFYRIAAEDEAGNLSDPRSASR